MQVEEACIMAQGGETTCYDSPDALVTAVTGQVSRGVTSADLGTDELVSQLDEGLQSNAGAYSQSSVAAAAAERTNALFYAGDNYSGAVLIMASRYSCSGSTVIKWDLLTPSWQNRINSGTGYGGCQFKVWDYALYRGASYGYRRTSITFGAMNNDAESVKMR